MWFSTFLAFKGPWGEIVSLTLKIRFFQCFVCCRKGKRERERRWLSQVQVLGSHSSFPALETEAFPMRRSLRTQLLIKLLCLMWVFGFSFNPLFIYFFNIPFEFFEGRALVQSKVAALNYSLSACRIRLRMFTLPRLHTVGASCAGLPFYSIWVFLLALLNANHVAQVWFIYSNKPTSKLNFGSFMAWFFFFLIKFSLNLFLSLLF